MKGTKIALKDRLKKGQRALWMIMAYLFLSCLPLASAQEKADKDAPSFNDLQASKKPVPLRVRRVLFKTGQLMEQQAYDKAILVFQTYLKSHPAQDHYLLAFNHANALTLAERKEEAIDRFQAAVKMMPGYSPAWTNLGQVALELKMYPLAGEALTRGFAGSREKNPEILYYAAMAYIMAGRPVKAVPKLETLLTGDYGEPPIEWFQALLSVYIELNQPGNAEQLINNMLRHHGAGPQAWKLYGQFEINRQNYKNAVVALTISGYLKPLSREDIILLADLHAAIQVYDQACALYEQAMTMKQGTPEEYERLVSACLAAHRLDGASKMLTEALRLQPTSKLWSLQGDLFCMQKDFQKATHAFQECTRLDERNGRAYLMQGYCALETGQRREAIKALKKASGYSNQKKAAQQLLKQAAP